MHPTELVLQELLKRLQDRHVDCGEAVAKKDAADAASAATVSPDTPNVLQAMMQLEQAKSRAEAANKLALEAEKERDAAEKVIRPPAPPDVSVCKGIMSCFSFLFLGVARHYAKRPFSCWCAACLRVRGRGTREGEDLDPSRVAQISWWQAVRVLSRPLGQKTSSQSHHQQGFGIARKG